MCAVIIIIAIIIFMYIYSNTHFIILSHNPNLILLIFLSHMKFNVRRKKLVVMKTIDYWSSL